MGDYGIMVSEAGDNVLTQIYDTAKFSTKYSTLKIYSSGNTSFTTNGSGVGSVEISHGLNYAPAFYVFNKDSYQDTFFEATTYSNCYFPIGVYSQFDVYSTNSVLHIGGTGLSASTTYYFRYYILVDLAQEFSSTSGIATTNDYGFKVSKPGVDVLTGDEYEMAYSSKYKSLQFYKESFQSETLTLPGYTASIVDDDPEAGTYVDFNHGLGYPPFFLAFFHSTIMTDANQYQELPWYYLTGSDQLNSTIYGWADATRIRIILKNYAYITPSNYPALSETATIKLYIFTENLNG